MLHRLASKMSARPVTCLGCCTDDVKFLCCAPVVCARIKFATLKRSSHVVIRGRRAMKTCLVGRVKWMTIAI